MAPKTKELVTICEHLPPRKVEELVDFARFLQQQAASESDMQWERIIADPLPRVNLDAFAQQALHEGEAAPLDPDVM